MTLICTIGITPHHDAHLHIHTCALAHRHSATHAHIDTYTLSHGNSETHAYTDAYTLSHSLYAAAWLTFA